MAKVARMVILIGARSLTLQCTLPTSAISCFVDKFRARVDGSPEFCRETDHFEWQLGLIQIR